jgi:hypothetical protein
MLGKDLKQVPFWQFGSHAQLLPWHKARAQFLKIAPFSVIILTRLESDDTVKKVVAPKGVTSH